LPVRRGRYRNVTTFGGDGAGVELLSGRLGPDGTTPGRAQQFGGEHLGRAHVVLDHGGWSGRCHRVEAADPARARMSSSNKPSHPFGFFTVDGDLVAPHADCGGPVESIFDQSEQFRPLPERPTMRWFPGTRILTWWTDTGSRSPRLPSRSGDHGTRLRHTRGETPVLGGCLTPVATASRRPPSTWRWRWARNSTRPPPQLKRAGSPRSATPSASATCRGPSNTPRALRRHRARGRPHRRCADAGPRARAGGLGLRSRKSHGRARSFGRSRRESHPATMRAEETIEGSSPTPGPSSYRASGRPRTAPEPFHFGIEVLEAARGDATVLDEGRSRHRL